MELVKRAEADEACYASCTYRIDDGRFLGLLFVDDARPPFIRATVGDRVMPGGHAVGGRRREWRVEGWGWEEATADPVALMTTEVL